MKTLEVASHRRRKSLGSYLFASLLTSFLFAKRLLSVVFFSRVKFLTEDGLFDMIRKSKPKESATPSQPPPPTVPVKGLYFSKPKVVLL